MTALKVIFSLLLFFFLLGLIRIGGEGEYSSEGFLLKFRLGRLKIQIFPKKEKAGNLKEPKTSENESKNPEKEAKKAAKKGGGIAFIKSALPLVGEAIGGIKRKIRIDDLEINYTVAGATDAAQAALSYGYANALIGAILPLFQENFQLVDYNIRTDVDYKLKEPLIYLRFAFSGRIGAILALFIRLGWKFLKNYRKNRPTTPAEGDPTEKGDKNG